MLPVYAASAHVRLSAAGSRGHNADSCAGHGTHIIIGIASGGGSDEMRLRITGPITGLLRGRVLKENGLAKELRQLCNIDINAEPRRV